MPTNKKIKLFLEHRHSPMHTDAHSSIRERERKKEISGTTEARPTDACGWSGI